MTRALEQHHDVTVLDRAQKPLDFPASSRLVYSRGDAYRIDRWVPTGERRDLKIVHLAAETSVRKSVLEPLSTVQTNIGVTCALLEFARKADPESFVFASSAAVYGEKRRACREDDLPDPQSPYAASKLAGEHYCRVYARLYGMPIVVLRYFNVYGPGQSTQYAGVITNFLKATSLGKPPTIFGDGKQTRDFIFVDDVVEATLKSLHKKLRPGITMNIGTGRTTSICNLAQKVLKLVNRKEVQPVHAPPRAGDIAFSKADVSFASREIGLRPRYSLDKGLKLTLNWLVTQRRS